MASAANVLVAAETLGDELLRAYSELTQGAV
jgi:hypothetical protein